MMASYRAFLNMIMDFLHEVYFSDILPVLK
jgi:hypothetical protein